MDGKQSVGHNEIDWSIHQFSGVCVSFHLYRVIIGRKHIKALINSFFRPIHSFVILERELKTLKNLYLKIQIIWIANNRSWTLVGPIFTKI